MENEKLKLANTIRTECGIAPRSADGEADEFEDDIRITTDLVKDLINKVFDLRHEILRLGGTLE